ncbi:D-amino acid dehydrogenase [Nitratireductor pacificus]|uniref:D-amino acid dehydrogenase n=1 Tax=Nitratireductor pacificus pht-3B TaxID=391937 RepID=K2ME28_9HYPH|nr:D-amino acid dehydrogenase [Nitratireductor pacificus]EKF20431.1 D-amino acid dehydrogenase small subunit [Nitratireductor pacificus pht-3B]
MRILILGGGVIGVTTAYYLAKSGHEVEVIDRQPGPAQETSFANAGQVSPGYSSPWAGPGIPLKAMKWLTMQHGPLVIRPRLDPAMWWWMLRMLRNCTSARYARNKARMVPIAEYSRDCLQALRAAEGIAYDERSQGTLQLFRSQEQLDAIAKDVDVLKTFGVAHEVLDRAGCIAREPGLATAGAGFVGGLRLPGDETGDCHLFTGRLAAIAEGLGVRFSYATEIRQVVCAGGRVEAVVTSDGRREADAVVVALGSHSPLLLRDVGIGISVYPVKGYSLTLPLTDPDAAPVSTIMDETYKTAITRLGDRIRVGGTAELAGYDLTLRPARQRALEKSFTDLFPRGGDVAQASFWCGLRPMTPDGPPLVGETPISGLYLNTGHGTLGWTMACGSGRVLTDIIDGREPEIDAGDLAYGRRA